MRTPNPGRPSFRCLGASAASALRAALLAALLWPALPAAAQDFTASATPNPVQLQLGGPGQVVTVSTAPDPSFTGTIVYGFVGLPSFVQTGPGQFTFPPSYPPVSFPFSLGPGAAPGTYNGVLRGTSGPLIRDFPFTVVVTAPDFSLNVAPPSLTLAPGSSGSVTVSVVGSGGFAGTATITAPTVSGVTFTPSLFGVPAGGSQAVNVAVAPGAAPGAFTGIFSGTAAGVSGIRTATLALSITAAPPPPPPPPPPEPLASFHMTVAPLSLTLVAGGAARELRVTTTAEVGFTAPITYSVVGLPPLLSASGSVTTTSPGYPQVELGLSAAATALPGRYNGIVRGEGGGVRREASFTVTVAPPPTFRFAVAPPTLEVRLGEAPAAFEITTTPEPGFSALLSYRLEGLPGFLQVAGDGRSGPPGYPPVRLEVFPAAAAIPGTYSGVVRVTSPLPPAAPASGEANVTVIVRPPLPVIESVTPAILVAGALPQEVRLVGRHFQPGATVRSDTAAVRVERVQVASPRLARVTLIAAPGAGPARVRLDLENPDGAATRDGALLAVLSADSLAAPLAVTTVAVVFPRPGSHLAPDEPIFARGVLAVGGGGTLVGSWVLDGTVFDRFVVQAVAGEPVPVLARVPIPALGLGLHRLVLRVESPQQVESPPVELVQTRHRATGLRLLAPQAGALADTEVELRWSLVPGAAAYLVEIEGTEPEGRLEHRTPEGTWSPGRQLLDRFGPGILRWRVRPLFPGEVEGDPTPWQELALQHEEPDATALGGRTASRPRLAAMSGSPGDPLAPLALAERSASWALRMPEEPVPEAAGAGSPAAPAASWATEVEAIARGTGGDPPREAEEGLLTFSGRLDGAGQPGSLQATTDLSLRRELVSGAATEGRSENWLLHGSARQATLEERLQVGYATPGFLHDLQFLASGLARGGTSATLTVADLVSVSYHESFDPELSGFATGGYGPDQDLRAAALQVGGDATRLLLRAVGLEVGEPQSAFSSGGRGRSYALFGRWAMHSALALSLEAARGDFEPAPGGFEEEREGAAYRLLLSGAAGTWTYALDLRRIEAGFVNPANRGLTPGGRSDRDVAELSLGTGLGRSRLELGLQRLEGGDSFGPQAEVSSARMRWSLPVTPVVYLAIGGSFTETDSAADTQLSMPANVRRQWAGDLSLSQTVGSFQIAQSLTVQAQEDRAQPTADATTTNLALNALGILGRLSLSASVIATRLEPDPSLGRTDSLIASFEPALSFPGLWLRFRPYLAFSETANDLFGSRTTSEQYRLTIGWDPPWAGSLIALEASGDWSRTRDRLFDPDTEAEVRYLAAFVVRWGGEGARPAVAAQGARRPAHSLLVGLAGVPTTPRARSLGSCPQWVGSPMGAPC